MTSRDRKLNEFRKPTYGSVTSFPPTLVWLVFRIYGKREGRGRSGCTAIVILMQIRGSTLTKMICIRITIAVALSLYSLNFT